MSEHRITPKQIETLQLIRDGKVKQRNMSYGAWRTIGANPSVVGRLISLGFARWNKPMGDEAELTETGRAALTTGGGHA